MNRYTDFFVFYEREHAEQTKGNWAWKRSQEANDVMNFLNGTGAYKFPVKEAKICAVWKNRYVDFFIFYQRNRVEQPKGNWAWKRSQTSEDVINFLNGTSAYKYPVNEAKICAVWKDRYIDFFVFYERERKEYPKGYWTSETFSAVNQVRGLLNQTEICPATTQYDKMVTCIEKDKRIVFHVFKPMSDWCYRIQLDAYLQERPRIRAQMCFETDDDTWLYYDYWPNSWKRRLQQFYLDFLFDRPLAKENPLPLSTEQISNFILYRNVELARDTYFAQVAHSLWLEIHRKVPWRFADWSDHELSFLLSSKVCFKALRSFPEDVLYYGVYVSSRSEATENILDDPRTPFQFMQQEPEQANRLLQDDPSKTAQCLSGWFHDYLWHNPASAHFNAREFHKSHPLLMDRLVRYDIEPYEDSVYVTPGGCGSASSLFMDLMRAVNIPIRKVKTEIEGYDGNMESHSGIIFDWQGGSGNGRYLLHTDDLFHSQYFRDTAPNPPDENRGITLWDHVWLNPTEFGQHFNYDSRPDILATASIAQKEKYWYLRQKLSCSSNAIRAARSGNVDRWITYLQSKGSTEEEAINAWETVIATVTAYGDGDLELGYQRLLDGPESRHVLWCNRTGKC